jgi:hypothetical protein
MGIRRFILRNLDIMMNFCCFDGIIIALMMETELVSETLSLTLLVAYSTWRKNQEHGRGPFSGQSLNPMQGIKGHSY